MGFSIYTLAHALSEFMPILGHWLGGEDGERIAQSAVNIAQNLTGEKEGSHILQALQRDPKLLVDFQQAILQMARDRDLAIYKDRDSARLRDMAIIQEGRRNLRADIMVIAAALGLIVCLITITLYRTNLPGEAVGIISTIAGIFGSCLKDAYAFEFGSSRGSKLKDNRLSAMVWSKHY